MEHSNREHHEKTVLSEQHKASHRKKASRKQHTDKRSKRRTRTVLIVIAAVALLCGIGGFAWWYFGSGSSVEGVVYVQSLAEIANQGGGALLEGRYSGIVEAKEIIEIKLDEDKQLGECFVEVGDTVKIGDPLFSYDVDSLMLTYEQLKLDYEGKLNNIATIEDQIADLEKQLKKARSSQKAELTIQLQTQQLNLRKEEYEAKKKKLDVDDAESVINDNVVKAKAGGTVRSINPPGDQEAMMNGGMSGSSAYITIVAGDDYRVKGTISEQGVFRLMEGTPAIIRSRIDESATWTGVIDSVNTEQPVENQNNYYYGNDMGEQASKYAFYVALDSIDGLIMGQHVYIELDAGQEDASDALQIPEYYILFEEEQSFVYAASNRGTIEKRAVTLGAYDPMLGMYEVVSGLVDDDRIAFPDESVQVGMSAADAGYAGSGDFVDAGGSGMDSVDVAIAVPIG